MQLPPNFTTKPDAVMSTIRPGLKYLTPNQRVEPQALHLSRLEQKYGDLTEVEVDEMLGLVCHVAPKVSPNNAMPRWVVFLVEFFLDVGSNIFLNVVLL